jgi:hypothetical protein
VSWKVETDLVNDPQTLPEFLDAAHVTVVAITVLSDGDVELDLFVCKLFPGLIMSSRKLIPHRIYRREQPSSGPI